MAARFTWETFSLIAALTFGNRSLSSFHFWLRAARLASDCNKRPKLLRSAMLMASLNESGMDPGRTSPWATLPLKKS